MKADGTVAAWGGHNNHGELNVPEGLSNVVAVSCAGYDSFALKADGTVVAWGMNSYGECDIASSSFETIRSICAGAGHAWIIESDGRAFGWGSNKNSESVLPSDLNTDVTKLAVGGDWYHDPWLGWSFGTCFTLAIDSNRKLWAWGYNEQGQTTIPDALKTKEIIDVAAGSSHSLALDSTGKVWGWGYNGYNNDGRARPPADLTNAVAVAAGSNHSVALREDGTVFCWGYNNYGQCNVPSDLKNYIVTEIKAGENHTVVLLSDGTVRAWGGQYSGTNPATQVPAGLSNVVAIASGNSFCLALKNDGTIVHWGNESAWSRGGNISLKPDSSLANVVMISASGNRALAVQQEASDIPEISISLQSSSDTGASSIDHITTETHPTFSIVCSHPGILTVDFDGDGNVDTTQSVLDTNPVNLTPSTLFSNGTYRVKATLSVSNFNPVVNYCWMRIDTKSPALIATSPQTNDTPLSLRSIDLDQWDLAEPLAGKNFIFSGAVERDISYDPSKKRLTFDPIYDEGEYTISVINAFDIAGNPVIGKDAFVVKKSTIFTHIPAGAIAWWPRESSGEDVMGGRNLELQGGVQFTLGK